MSKFNYKNSFYLTKPVWNNAFSYENRKNKKLFVPSLLEIDNYDDIKLQDKKEKIAFEDYDFDGKLSTNYWLKNFYKIIPLLTSPKGRGITAPIYLFDNHNHAYFFWYLARKEGIIWDNNTLVHIDEHADTRDSQKYLMKPDSENLNKVFDFTNEVLNVGNYIIPAQKEWLIWNIIQIRNESNLKDYIENRKGQTHRSAPTENVGVNLCVHPDNDVILNLDLDFFQPNLNYINYNLKKKVIQNAAKKAKIITVATSPFFINQEYAIKVFKDIFG